MALGTRLRSSTSWRRWSGWSASTLPVQPMRRVGGLVAGRGQQVDVAQYLLAGQAAHGAGLVLELGLEQLGHQVVGRMGGPPVDVLGEALGGAHALAEGLVEVGHVPLGQAQSLVDPIADGLLVGFGDAQQHADGAHGHLGAEVRDEVEPAPPDQRVEAAGTELADLGLEVVDVPGGEHPGQQAAVDVVRRGVLEDDRARRQHDVGLDDLEQGALARDVGLPVLRAGVDVVEAAQGVEVVALVVVERALVP